MLGVVWATGPDLSRLKVCVFLSILLFYGCSHILECSSFCLPQVNWKSFRVSLGYSPWGTPPVLVSVDTVLHALFTLLLLSSYLEYEFLEGGVCDWVISESLALSQELDKDLKKRYGMTEGILSLAARSRHQVLWAIKRVFQGERLLDPNWWDRVWRCLDKMHDLCPKMYLLLCCLVIFIVIILLGKNMDPYYFRKWKQSVEKIVSRVVFVAGPGLGDEPACPDT